MINEYEVTGLFFDPGCCREEEATPQGDLTIKARLVMCEGSEDIEVTKK